MKKITINKNDAGQRLDNFLKKMYPHISKVLFIKWIRNKDIKVNGIKCAHNQMLNLNDEISIFFDHYLKNEKKNNFLFASDNLKIIYEDDNVLIIDKPIGLLSHSDDKNENDTVINRIKKYLVNKNEWNYKNENTFEPSLVNRIDYNTSGIIVAAKNYSSLKELNNIFKFHQLEKRYYALVHGHLNNKDWNEIKVFINDQDSLVKVYNSYQINTKIAITKYRKIKTIDKYTLLEIQLVTGRKHQIRACLNYIGFPIVGEQKYANKKFNSNSDKYKTQCLISYYLKFKIIDNNNCLYYLNKLEFKINKIWFLN